MIENSVVVDVRSVQTAKSSARGPITLVKVSDPDHRELILILSMSDTEFLYKGLCLALARLRRREGLFSLNLEN